MKRRNQNIYINRRNDDNSKPVQFLKLSGAFSYIASDSRYVLTSSICEQRISSSLAISGTLSVTGSLFVYENVGIGTTTPAVRLEVNGAIKMPPANTTDNNSPGLIFSTGDDFLFNDRYINHYGFGFHYPTGDSVGSYVSGYYGVNLFTGGAKRVGIDQNGRVNIGSGFSPGHCKLSLSGANASIGNGPNIVMVTDADSHPLIQILNYSHDNCGISFDAYHNGTNWVSSDAGSNFQTYKYTDRLLMMYDSDVSPGDTVDWNTGISLNKDGKVGIGVIDPADKLQVNYGTNHGLLGLNQTTPGSYNIDVNWYDNGALRWITTVRTTSNDNFWIYNVARAFPDINIDATTGNVGMGVAPQYQLDVKDDAASSFVASFFNDGNNANRYGIRILAGEDSPSAINYFVHLYDGDGGELGGLCYNNATGDVEIWQTSDEKLKKDIKSTNVVGLDILKKIPLKEFVYRNNKIDIGFVAQDCEKAYPQMVGRFKECLHITPTSLIPVLVKSIQEQNEIINNLTKRLEILENK